MRVPSHGNNSLPDGMKDRYEWGDQNGYLQGSWCDLPNGMTLQWYKMKVGANGRGIKLVTFDKLKEIYNIQAKQVLQGDEWEASVLVKDANVNQKNAKIVQSNKDNVSVHVMAIGPSSYRTDL